MADSTLTAIITKVRRLTHVPSQSQLSDATIVEYIDAFVLYDFPEHLRLNSLRTTLRFYTEPNVDIYETNTTSLTHPLYNFKNKYITVHQPVFIAGYPAWFSQDRAEFYSRYPIMQSNITTGYIGDSIVTNFSGTLSSIPLLANNVTFTSKTAANVGLQLHDDGAGILTGDGTGTINYVTGAYSLIFSTAPGSSQHVRAQVVPYQAARPSSMLYYDTKFVVRPVPDQVYTVSMEVYIRPSEFFSTDMTQKPEFEQWWQYIAYGTARKVFQDRMDLDSVAMLDPEYKRQELLVNRRTIVQQAGQRTGTIYTGQIGGFTE